MKYNCDKCDYHTDSSKMWYKHKNTQKHKNVYSNENREIIKVQKDMLKKQKELFEKEKQIMKENELLRQQVLEKENELLKKEMQIKEQSFKQELKMKDQIIEQQKQSFNEQKQVLLTDSKHNRKLCNKSMSNLEFLIKNYSQAPPLKAVEDYSCVGSEIMFIRTLIGSIRHSNMHKCLGDIVNTYYKKQNPEEQSNWNTDTERLHYIIKTPIENNNGWVIDKKGIKMTKIVIDPLLEYVKVLGKKYQQIIQKDIKDNDGDDSKCQFNLKDLSDLTTVVNAMNEKKQITNDINRYIANHFYLEK